MTDARDTRDTRDEALDDGSPSEDSAAAPSPVSRRAALKVLGAVPVAGALAGGIAWGQQAPRAAPAQQAPRQGHETPNQPTHSNAATPRSAPKRAFFTAAEWKTMSVLADDIIPKDARSVSATEAGVLPYMDFHLSVPETDDGTRVAFRGGLAWLNTESRRRFGVAYASAKAPQRHQILDDIAWPDKVKPGFSHGTAFFSRVRDMVGAGFFSSAQGWQDLQYQGNVFNPNWQGCPDAALRKLGVSYALMETRIKPE